MRYRSSSNARGFEVAPAELEGHLLDHPDVNDACVVGVPDDYSGEVPLAFICLAPKAEEKCERDSRHTEAFKASMQKVRGS